MNARTRPSPAEIRLGTLRHLHELDRLLRHGAASSDFLTAEASRDAQRLVLALDATLTAAGFFGEDDLACSLSGRIADAHPDRLHRVIEAHFETADLLNRLPRRAPFGERARAARKKLPAR